MEAEKQDKIGELVDSFNGNFDLTVEIKDKTFIVQKEVWDLIHNISKERDSLKEAIGGL